MSPPLGSVRAKYIVDFAPRYFKESASWRQEASEKRNLEIIQKKKPSNKPTGEAVNAANREIKNCVGFWFWRDKCGVETTPDFKFAEPFFFGK